MSNMKKWKVTFTTPQSNGRMLTEIVTDTSWQYARLKLISRYAGINIKAYSSVSE
jgi:hypothetical protein